MSESAKNPKVFISYSNSSLVHNEKVIRLSEDLTGQGVKVIAAFWDLAPGHDMNKFMEKMVFDKTINKVIMICDKQYAEKANERKKGVGIETEIISAEMYNKAEQEKFIPVFFELDENGNPYLPIYCKTRFGIDMSEQYQEGFDQLLRTIYGEPQYRKPEIGKKPDFVADNPVRTNRTSTFLLAKLLCDNIRVGNSNVSGLLEDYFEEFAKSMKQFTLHDMTDDFEPTIENITNFLPYRNEIINVFSNIARYLKNEESINIVHKFFEKIISYYNTHGESGVARNTNADNFKFLIHEMFLYAIAAFIKQGKFKYIASLTNTGYYFPVGSRDRPMVPFTIIRQSANSFDARNTEKQLRRMSLRADLLIERADASGFESNEIMQADFVLCIKGIALNINNPPFYSGYFDWYPDTYVYLAGSHYPLEMFARAESQEYFDRIKIMWGIESSDEIVPFIDSISGIGQGQYRHAHTLANIKNLCKSP